MWRRTHMIHANPANPRVATTRLLMSRGNTTAMVRTGLFMNEDGNVFSACMTREEELGRLLGGRKNEPLVPPAFITSAVLKSFAVPLGSGSDASKSAASLQEQSSSTAPHRHSRPVSRRRGGARRHGNRALAARASIPREAGNTWTFYPLPFHTARIRDPPGSDAARISHRRSRQCQHYAMPL